MLRTALSIVMAGACLACATARATTWDEPWQQDVVAQADTFGLFEVVSVKGAHATLHTIKTLAGMPTPPDIDLDGYYALQLASMSGRDYGETDLPLVVGKRFYLFPRHVGSKWQTATPKAGIDAVLPDGMVAATYRISFHQTMQPVAAYERVQACIYTRLHGGDCDAKSLKADLVDPLAQPPAEPPGHKDLFFQQHVALESSFLLKRPLPLDTIEPFLKSGFVHQQLGAVRALYASDDKRRDARIVAFVKDESRHPSARAMAIFLAGHSGDAALVAQLKAWKPKDPELATGLGLDIMDPRIATRFPRTIGMALEML